MTRYTLLTALFGAICFFAFELVAQNKQKGVVLKELRNIQKNLDKINRLSFQFTQSSYKHLRKKTTTSSGEVFFQRPSNFRWDIAKPLKRSWIYNGKELYWFNPSKNEATSYSATGGKVKELTQIVDFVLNFAILRNSFEVSLVKKETSPRDAHKNDFSMMLVPKHRNDIKFVEVTFSSTQQLVNKIKMTFRNSNHTTLIFTQPVLNQANGTTFALPKNVRLQSAG